MKKKLYSLLLLVIVTVLSSCSKNPQSIAFITSVVNVPITLYSAKDSVVLTPLQRTYLTHLDIINNQIIACGSSGWNFSVLEPVVKIGFNDTVLDVLEGYSMFLSEIENYTHSGSIVNGLGERAQVEDSYDYILKTEFLKLITGYN